MYLKGMHAHIVGRTGLDGERHECQLQVRIFDACAAADETAGLEVVGSRGTRQAGEPPKAGRHLAETPIGRIKRDRLGTLMLDHDVGMIVQVRTHCLELMPGPHAGGLQQLRGADAGQLQQLRRVDGSRGYDHIAFRADALDASPSEYSTPVARRPSRSTRCASAPVSTVRFGRRRASVR